MFTVNKYITYISIFFLFSACQLFDGHDENKDSKLVAKVFGYELYQDDLIDVFPSNMSSEDSVAVTKILIESWAKKKVLMQKALLNMPSENKELELLVEKYREDLFINYFKNALVAKQLDTIVSKVELRSYYENNKESFRLNEELVKFRFIVVKENSKNKKKYNNLFWSSSKNNMYMLEEDSVFFEDFFLNDSIWFRYKDVKQKLPILRNFKDEVILKSNKRLVKTLKGNTYYVLFKDVAKRNEIAPLRFVSKTIEKLVLQQRKLQLIQKAEEVLVDDAIKNKQFEIY